MLLRTGFGRRRHELGDDAIQSNGRPGWHASCLPVFRDHDVAIIGADTAQDVSPSGYPDLRVPVHIVGLVAMGLFMIDNLDLEALATACRDAGRSTFLFTVAPLPFVGTSGSPVNPLAVL